MDFPWDYMSVEVKEAPLKEYLYEQASLKEKHKIIDKLGFYQDEFSKITKIYIEKSDRYFLLSIPNDIEDEYQYPIVFCFHGLAEWAWDLALEDTDWRKLSKENNFILIFAQGTNCGSLIDNSNGFNVKNPDEDFNYIHQILEILPNQIFEIKFNMDRLYYFGFSNGGIFSSHIVQKYGSELFSAVCNCMGGFGKECKEVPIYNTQLNPLPLFIVTADNDEYKSSCIFCKEYFENNNFPVIFKIIKDIGHVYPKGIEKEVWDFFIKN